MKTLIGLNQQSVTCHHKKNLYFLTQHIKRFFYQQIRIVQSSLHPLVRNEVLRVADILLIHDEFSEDPGGVVNDRVEEARVITGTFLFATLHAGGSPER